MISTILITSIKDFVYQEIDKYQAPSKFHVDLSIQKGQWLSDKLSANKDLVLLGTLLMDCKLGQAFKEGRLKDHIDMSLKKADQLLSADPDITKQEKEIILESVSKHHGSDKFLSKEAEICCNADCYRFVSVKGVIGGMKASRDMPLSDLIKLYSQKSDEKWHALTLDICRQELEPQHQAIKTFLDNYQD